MAVNNSRGDQVYTGPLDINDYTYTELGNMVIWLLDHDATIKSNAVTGCFCIIFSNRESQVEFHLVWGDIL